jgi:hypothetical protein
MNSDSDERPGGSYSPTVLCAQTMGRESLCAASCVLFRNVSNPDGAIYKTSWVSQESGEEGAPAQPGVYKTYRVSQESGEEGVPAQPWVEVLQQLWGPLRIKKGSSKTFPIPSRHARRHPSGQLARHGTPPAFLPRLATPKPMARPGLRRRRWVRVWHRFLPFSTSQ